jgi:hypothetical protein
MATANVDDLCAGNALTFASAAKRCTLYSVHINIPTMHLNYVCNGYNADVTTPTIQHDMILMD